MKSQEKFLAKVCDPTPLTDYYTATIFSLKESLIIHPVCCPKWSPYNMLFIEKEYSVNFHVLSHHPSTFGLPAVPVGRYLQERREDGQVSRLHLG